MAVNFLYKNFANQISSSVRCILYALGVCMTPNMMAHADKLLSAMLLTLPSRNLLKEIIIGEKTASLERLAKKKLDAHAWYWWQCKNASIISFHSRVNGPEPCKSKSVKAGIDVLHAAKAMGKHVCKITAENVTTIEKFLTLLCDAKSKRHDFSEVWFIF